MVLLSVFPQIPVFRVQHPCTLLKLQCSLLLYSFLCTFAMYCCFNIVFLIFCLFVCIFFPRKCPFPASCSDIQSPGGAASRLWGNGECSGGVTRSDFQMTWTLKMGFVWNVKDTLITNTWVSECVETYLFSLCPYSGIQIKTMLCLARPATTCTHTSVTFFRSAFPKRNR